MALSVSNRKGETTNLRFDFSASSYLRLVHNPDESSVFVFFIPSFIMRKRYASGTMTEDQAFP
ncbi:unnamed protein product [Brassica oleracea]